MRPFFNPSYAVSLFQSVSGTVSQELVTNSYMNVVSSYGVRRRKTVPDLDIHFTLLIFVVLKGNSLCRQQYIYSYTYTILDCWKLLVSSGYVLNITFFKSEPHVLYARILVLCILIMRIIIAIYLSFLRNVNINPIIHKCKDALHHQMLLIGRHNDFILL